MANDFTPSGAPSQRSDGEVPAPSAVNFTGNASPLLNASLSNLKGDWAGAVGIAGVAGALGAAGACFGKAGAASSAATATAARTAAHDTTRRRNL